MQIFRVGEPSVRSDTIGREWYYRYWFKLELLPT
jgi:hypothetical protein